jgi:hypothetical protein
MDIIEEEENENPDLFNERKMTANTYRNTVNQIIKEVTPLNSII